MFVSTMSTAREIVNTVDGMAAPFLRSCSLITSLVSSFDPLRAANCSGWRSSVTEIGSSQQGQVPPGPSLAGEAVALLAVLLADEPDLTHRALVDGVGLGDDRLSRRLAAAAPGGLTAGLRAMEPAPRTPEGCPADGTRHRLGIVTHAVHAATSSERSTSTPLWKSAPARTRATRWGRVDAPPAALGRGDELVGHGESGRA